MLTRLIEGLSRIEGRPAPYNEVSIEIKDKVLPNNSRTGTLLDFHINDMVQARKEVHQFYNQNGEQIERLNYSLRIVQPRVAPVIDDDPFL